MSELSFLKFVDLLETQDYFEIPEFLLQTDVEQIRAQISKLKLEQKFRSAKIGQKKVLETNIRSDEICWIDDEIHKSSSALQKYFLNLKEIQSYLKEKFFLSTQSVESHFAIYQVGQYYKKHADVGHEESPRVLSLICYLNRGEGGELRIYLKDGFIDITPQPGKLVGFLSRGTEHEVLESQFERFTITSWLLKTGPFAC